MVHRVATRFDAQLDLRSTAMLEPAAPALDACSANDETRLTRREPNQVSIAALRCRGMVILSDTTRLVGVRRWTPASLYPACISLSAAVPARRHRIEMRYRPASV